MTKTCFDCRKRQAPALQQKMASLPENRVTPSKPPFTSVGVDCFGPFTVRRGRTTAIKDMAYYLPVLLFELFILKLFIPWTLNPSLTLYVDSLLDEENQKRSDPTTEETLLRAKRSFARLLNKGIKSKSMNSSCNEISFGHLIHLLHRTMEACGRGVSGL